MILFLLTILFSYIGSMPFGMINLNVLHAQINDGRKAALQMAVGAALIECAQGVVAAIIYSRLIQFTQIADMLRIATIIVLIGLAIYYFIKPKSASADLASADKKSTSNPFTQGVFLSSINFMAIPFWLIIISIISSYMIVQWDTFEIATFGVGAGLGGFLTSLTYAIIGQRFIKPESLVYKNLNYILAVLFLGMAAFTGLTAL